MNLTFFDAIYGLYLSRILPILIGIDIDLNDERDLRGGEVIALFGAFSLLRFRIHVDNIGGVIEASDTLLLKLA